MENSPPHPFPESGGLPRQDYRALRQHLGSHSALKWTLLVLALDGALICAAIALLNTATAVGFLTAQFLLVLVYFHGFAIMHDAGHGSAAKSKLANAIVGHYASIFCFLPFYPWKYIHQAHHSWTGNIERDPTLKLVKDFNARRRVKNGIARFCWACWVPVSALFQHFVFWGYPFRLLADRSTGWKIRLKCVFSIVLLSGALIGLHWAWPEIFRFGNFGISMVVYLVVVELINFPHHLDTEMSDDPTSEGKLPVWRQSVATRSCYYPFPLSEALFLNFNFHVEHHTFPNLPWWRLRGVREGLRDKVDGYQECRGIGWNLANRKRDLFEVAIPPWRRETEKDASDE